MDTPVSIQHPEAANLPVEKIGGLNQAIMFAFLCNKIGNFVGWGTFLFYVIGIVTGFGPLITLACISGLLILPILVPVLCLINIGVALALLLTRFAKGSWPRFHQPRDYFIKGVIRSILFLFGSISYVAFFYYALITFSND